MDEDRKLVQRVISKEAGAAAELVEKYGGLVWSILRKMGLPCECDDLFGEVFLHLFENDCHRLKLWRGDGRFISYLAVMVRRLSLDYLQSQRRHDHLPLGHPDDLEEPDHPGPDPPCPDPGPEALALLEEKCAAIRAALQQLSLRDRELIQRKHFHEQRYAEIARAMGMTVNHVGVALSRAEKRLRAILEENSDAEEGVYG